MRATLSILALLSCTGAACETGGRSVWGTLTGRKVVVVIPEALPAEFDDEIDVAWDRIVVGVRPNNRNVGYLQTREYTPAGTHKKLRISYIWPETLEGPWGYLTAGGAAYRFRIDRSSDADYMGHMPIEVACLHVLGVCPKCGHRIDREVLHQISRPDLGPERTRDFRYHMADHHRRSRDIHPTMETALHARRGGGVTLDHACEACQDTRVQPLTGNVQSLRVQFEELTAADLMAKPAAPPPLADAGAEDDDG